MKKQIYRNIHTPEQLGIAHLGSPHMAIVHPVQHIDRAEYGRRLAAAEGGIFTAYGYCVPVSEDGRAENVA